MCSITVPAVIRSIQLSSSPMLCVFMTMSPFPECPAAFAEILQTLRGHEALLENVNKEVNTWAHQRVTVGRC